MASQALGDLTVRGEVVRRATSTLAYVHLDEPQIILPVQSFMLQGRSDATFDDVGLEAGSNVVVVWRPAENSAVSLTMLPQGPSHRSSPEHQHANLPRPTLYRDSSVTQIALHPEAAASSTTAVARALDPKTRAFGKIIDPKTLQPGDLLLSQELAPDGISSLITQVQLDGGYSEEDSKWTHAAIYLGDGEHVVEATFESLFKGGSVRITKLDAYCQGHCSLRFRRSRFIQSPHDGWRLCIRALSRLHQPYDFALAARLWWDVTIRRIGFYTGQNQRATCTAVICSTLYADAYNETTRRSLGEIGGACVPAWLSFADEFNDLAVSWSQIK